MRIAGFWVRALAHLIDFALWNGVELAIQTGVADLFGLSSVLEQVIGVFISLAILYGYYVEIPVRYGTTPGKRLFGIVVLDTRTELPLSRKVATIRMLSYGLSYAVIGCGFLMALFHPQRLGLHDLIAHTVSVIRKASDPKALEKKA